MQKERNQQMAKTLLSKSHKIGDLNVIAEKVDIDSAQSLKDLAFQVKAQTDNLCLVLAAEIEGKANLAVMISDNLVKEKNLHAGNIIREISKEVDGGGGGQPFFATAGGKNPQGIEKALAKAKVMIGG